MEDEHIVPALAEQPQAAEQARAICQQVRDQHHQAPPRRRFGNLAKDGIHVGLVSRLLNGQRIHDAENVVLLGANRHADANVIVERYAADTVLLPQNQIGERAGKRAAVFVFVQRPAAVAHRFAHVHDQRRA